jgi:hypothetical protein
VLVRGPYGVDAEDLIANRTYRMARHDISAFVAALAERRDQVCAFGYMSVSANRSPSTRPSSACA